MGREREPLGRDAPSCSWHLAYYRSEVQLTLGLCPKLLLQTSLGKALDPRPKPGCANRHPPAPWGFGKLGGEQRQQHPTQSEEGTEGD